MAQFPADMTANGKSFSLFRHGALLLAFLMSLGAAQGVLAQGWKLKDRDGVSYTLPSLKGKWVLVNFWAPWCPVCIEEMPVFNALQKERKDLQIIGVAVMYLKQQEVIDVVQARKLAYPVVLGTEDLASEFGEMRGMPTSFLYAPSGKLVGRHDGPLSQHDIEQVIAQAPEAARVFTGGD